MQRELDFDANSAVEAHAVIRTDVRLRSDPRVRDVRCSLVPGKAVQFGELLVVRCWTVETPLRGLPVSAFVQLDDRWLTPNGSRLASYHTRVFTGPMPFSRLPVHVLETARLGRIIISSEQWRLLGDELDPVVCPAGVFQVVEGGR